MLVSEKNHVTVIYFIYLFQFVKAPIEQIIFIINSAVDDELTELLKHPEFWIDFLKYV